MRNDRGLLPWWVTRVLFSLGTMSIFSGVFPFLLRSAPTYSWVLVLVGLILIVVSVRGPWDSEDSGRNRSVLGFKARPGPDQNR
jgi:hypothetical protein